jgi:hypothetical protein
MLDDTLAWSVTASKLIAADEEAVPAPKALE